MAVQLSLKDLRAQLAEFKDKHPKFDDSDLFVLWFLRSYITENEDRAATAVAGGSGDKGIDAILIDERAQAVFIVQGKYRHSIAAKSEKRSDVLEFASLAAEITQQNETSFKEFASDMEEYTADLLRNARKLILTKQYRLCMYYATLANCSPGLEKEARKRARNGRAQTSFEIVAGRRILYLLRDYLDGVAPPIPTLDLEMESQGTINVNGILQRYDNDNAIESWAISMNGNVIADLFDYAGVRLFARNIRGFLGESTPVNEDMAQTIHREPDHFFYYNNGITIICDAAERVASKGKDVLRVSNPQIINGQQTTRCLAANRNRAARVSVLVKVIQVSRGENAHDGFDDLVSRIVAGTNWQNAISQADLMSNDRRQIEIDRALRKLNYVYLRKRQTKGEAKVLMGGKGKIAIKKEELAQASAACDLDPHVIRSGKDHLFGDEYYRKVFPNANPWFYLPKYWIMKAVSSQASGYPQRSYAKWMVTGFTWYLISDSLRSPASARAFCERYERNDAKISRALEGIIEQVFVAAGRFYRKHRGSGDEMVDVSQFYRNRTGRHREFRTFWNGRSNVNRPKTDRLARRFHGLLHES